MSERSTTVDGARTAHAARVADWLRGNAGVELDPAGATMTRLAGGNSNETFVLSSGERRVVVRMPPAHGLDPSAHSMAREWVVLRALNDTAARAPRALAYCADAEVAEAPFLAMEFVADAVSVLDELPPAYRDTSGAASELGVAAIDGLATVHTVDWRAAGLEEFGRPEGYLARQVPRWESQFRRNQTRELPMFDRVRTWLAENTPSEQPAALLHGDFHLDNCLVSVHRPEVVSIVDWEMSTIGDPLVDVGLFLALWGRRPVTRPAMPRLQAVSRSGKVIDRRDLVVRYADRTGRDVSHVDWYLVFALWKLGAVVEAAWARHVRGLATSDYSAALRHDVPALFEEAAALAGVG